MESKLTDEELVEKIIRQDDKEAIQLLLFRYESECRKMVYSRLKRFYYRYYDIDEFMQLVRLTTIGIVKKYDPDKGSFHAYWSCAINRVITSEIRRLNSKSRSLEVGQSTLFKEEFNDDFLENMAGNSILITQQLNIEETLDRIDEIKMDYLNEIERMVLSYRLAGFSYKEIAKKIKSTPKRVDNIMNAIRKKIKKYL